MKNNILLKGLDLSYSKEAKDFKKRMLGNAGSIQLKNINIHLYEGEVLGLLSALLYSLLDVLIDIFAIPQQSEKFWAQNLLK